ncbi:MAG: hypothetical protein M1826_007427 [Phylliscum demangeonii]|nr:MAG: hypothetical protein M1826_007427 [Phylliscum demangeonii]
MARSWRACGGGRWPRRHAPVFRIGAGDEGAILPRVPRRRPALSRNAGGRDVEPTAWSVPDLPVPPPARSDRRRGSEEA